jgi:type I restriction enzyme S subunit
MSTEFPKGWATTKIDGLFEFKYGKGLPKEKRIGKGSIEVYGSNGVVGTHDRALTKGTTIVVGRKGSVGEVNISHGPCWPIDTTYFIDQFPSGLPPNYWALYLKSLRLGQQEKSSAIPGISRDDIYELEVPVPPLKEQFRTLAKLEKLLGKVDACQKRLAKIPVILKRFRQSVLAAACSGRLTADWREGHPHAESSNQLSDANEDIPSPWTWRTIRELVGSAKGSIQSGPFGSNLLHSEFQPTGILAIGIDNVLDGKFSLGRQHRISAQKYEMLRKYTARPLDLLVTVMATVGRCCVVPDGIETAIITKHVYRITVDQTVANPYYIMQCIRGCPSVLAQVESEIQGVTRPGINGTILKEIRIPLPPLDEQHEIVRRVEALFALADQIEGRFLKAKANVDKLTQSILAKAFRGDLVPQDPNDEPASVLLKRIKEERAKREMEAKGKTTRKNKG